MRICVVGAGAIGGFIASGLAASETDTSVLARGATLAAIKARGLRVESADGTVTATVTAAGDAAELGPQDVVILAVKAQAAQAAVAGIGPLLGPDTAVLSTLNGVPWWFFDGFGGPCQGRHLDSVDPGGAIATAIPVSRVIGGTVHMSASSPEPGVVMRYAGNGIIIGEPDGTDSPRLQSLAAVLRKAGLAVTISANIREDVWYKLWGNLTINPVSALTGATADQILDDDLVRGFCESAMLEAREIGARIGCPISETPGDRNLVTRKLGAFRTSMLQDAEAGRALELDALAGAVREIGTIVGVPTPYVDALYGLTRLSARARAGSSLPGNPLGSPRASPLRKRRGSRRCPHQGPRGRRRRLAPRPARSGRLARAGLGCHGRGAVRGRDRGLAGYITRTWEELSRPCSERAVDYALACAARRVAAHSGERAVLVHGDVHEWNALQAGDGCAGFRLVDPDGLLAEPEYDLGVIMREDPAELLHGDPWERARWLARRCGLDATAIWEWGVVERMSTGLLLTSIGLQPVGRQMLTAADAVARG